MRLILLAVLLCLGCKLATGRWPWAFAALSPTRSQALTQARNLLGVSYKASRPEILDAHKRLVAIIHPDRGGTADQVHEANAARDLLLAALPDQS